MSSGVHPNEYILSHVLTQTMVVVLQTFSVLMIAFLIFEIPNRGSIFWVSVLIVMQGVCGMAYGILISAITKEENFTLILCMGSMFPQFLLSGKRVLLFVSLTPHSLSQVWSGRSRQCPRCCRSSALCFLKGRALKRFAICYTAVGVSITSKCRSDS